MLLSHDVAVNKWPKMTSASYSSTYSCTPDSFNIDPTRASTAFGAPQPGSQYSSTAGVFLNPVRFLIPETEAFARESRVNVCLLENTTKVDPKYAPYHLLWGGHPHLAVVCRGRSATATIDRLFSLVLKHLSHTKSGPISNPRNVGVRARVKSQCLFAGKYFDSCFKICTLPPFFGGGNLHLAVVCRGRFSTNDGLFYLVLKLFSHTTLALPIFMISVQSPY